MLLQRDNGGVWVVRPAGGKAVYTGKRDVREAIAYTIAGDECMINDECGAEVCDECGEVHDIENARMSIVERKLPVTCEC